MYRTELEKGQLGNQRDISFKSTTPVEDPGTRTDGPLKKTEAIHLIYRSQYHPILKNQVKPKGIGEKMNAEEKEGPKNGKLKKAKRQGHSGLRFAGGYEYYPLKKPPGFEHKKPEVGLRMVEHQSRHQSKGEKLHAEGTCPKRPELLSGGNGDGTGIYSRGTTDLKEDLEGEGNGRDPQ